MEKTKIYLAGKIKSNGWRQSIFDMRHIFCGQDYPACKESVESLKYKSVHIKMYDNDVLITGPFFLSCDHSCYHGEGTHGLGKNKPGLGYDTEDCYGAERTYTEQEVIDICKTQIERADIVFAYINDDTCYGSLFELGMAKQMGKKIVTIFDTKERERNMWFIAKSSDYSMCLYDECSDEIFKYFEPHEVDSIEDIKEKIKIWMKRYESDK